MKPLPVPSDMDDSDYVSQTLRQCALILDPRNGKLTALEDEFDIHVTTIRTWMRNGRIPPKPCRRLLKRFGRKWINVERLTGGA